MSKLMRALKRQVVEIISQEKTDGVVSIQGYLGKRTMRRVRETISDKGYRIYRKILDEKNNNYRHIRLFITAK